MAEVTVVANAVTMYFNRKKISTFPNTSDSSQVSLLALKNKRTRVSFSLSLFYSNLNTVIERCTAVLQNTT